MDIMVNISRFIKLTSHAIGIMTSQITGNSIVFFNHLFRLTWKKSFARVTGSWLGEYIVDRWIPLSKGQ